MGPNWLARMTAARHAPALGAGLLGLAAAGQAIAYAASTTAGGALVPYAALQSQVRCLRYRGPADAAPPLPELLAAEPARLRVLEDRSDDRGRTVMVSGEPEVLEALEATAPGWQVVVPSLEDAFVALVRRPITY